MQSTIPQTDAALLSAYQAGSVSAIEELVYRYKDRIYTAIAILVKDRNLAEDIFQETFLKVIRTIKNGGYSEQGKFLPFALRVAHNLCMDHFRRVRQHIPITLPDGRDLSEILPLGEASHAGERMERRQTHEGIRSLVDLLPEEQKEVVVMRMYGELSFKEIAAATGVSINTALGRMRYALINLRKMIDDKGMVLR
jgi:RNA polymerase sigma-70 factor (ECF subfamily)